MIEKRIPKSLKKNGFEEELKFLQSHLCKNGKRMYLWEQPRQKEIAIKDINVRIDFWPWFLFIILTLYLLLMRNYYLTLHLLRKWLIWVLGPQKVTRQVISGQKLSNIKENRNTIFCNKIKMSLVSDVTQLFFFSSLNNLTILPPRASTNY